MFGSVCVYMRQSLSMFSLFLNKEKEEKKVLCE